MTRSFMFLSLCVLLSSMGATAQRRVLFLGNSYTAANNLPQMIADAALSAGDTLYFDSNTPGGYTLEGHSTNAASISKIQSGDWDYVVLQDQSQRPSFPISQVEIEVFPFARKLDSIINQYNTCGETMFYMTWGRKNGDALNCPSWPPVCTYSGMDSLLHLRYMMMGDSNQAVVSPVGAVWNYIRTNYPAIDLYQADESHPSVTGSYAAACCFYTAIFRKDPLMITFNSSLSAGMADTIRQAVRTVVFDSLSHWYIGTYDPLADFQFQVNALQVSFTNQSLYADHFFWSFGDGDTSDLEHPSHVFPDTGTYSVMLISEHCGKADTSVQYICIISTGMINQEEIQEPRVSPNPFQHELFIMAGDRELTHIKLYQLNGQILHPQIDNSHGYNRLKFTEIASGQYILEFRINEKMFKHHVICIE